MVNNLIKPYNNDPELGHLSTPISDSALVRTFINNLPAYRKGLSPLMRGLEVGLAHGYFLVGPEILLGALRDYNQAPYFAGFVTAISLVLLGTVGMSVYGVANCKSADESPAGTEKLKTSEGWSEFTAGFFIGGTGGAYMAYLLLDHFTTVDAIFRGFVN